MKQEPDPSGTDVLFALVFLAAVFAGTWWFATIVSDTFTAALWAHMEALARGKIN